MARLPELINFKKKWGYKLISIASLIEYRHQRDQLIEKIAESEFNSEFGGFILHEFRSILDNRLHYALTLGNISDDKTTLVRVQTANVLTDALGLIEKPHQSNPIQQSLKLISEKGSEPSCTWSHGDLKDLRILIYKRQIAHDQNGFSRLWNWCSNLGRFRSEKIQLLTRDSRKVVGLEGYGLEIVERTLLKY